MEGQWGGSGWTLGCHSRWWETLLCAEPISLFQMYHNNVLEFYIVTTDENECNWMMFVRKARYNDGITCRVLMCLPCYFSLANMLINNSCLLCVLCV